MSEALLERGAEQQQAVPIGERCLTEVDNLNRMRSPDGIFSQATLDYEYQNLQTAVQEGAMPNAISTTHHEYRNGTYWWHDQTIVDVAESGYRFHRSEAARRRVAVEVDEAKNLEYDLRPGSIKVLISPKMTRADASYEVAKEEHLADDDMIRIHMADYDENGTCRGKFMQSLLVKDIPLSAWVALLEDPNNIFGKSIPVRDRESALGVMEVHAYMELPTDRLPNGVLDIVEAVMPYLDVDAFAKVQEQVELFKCDQEELQRRAENIAARWLAFEIDLANSLNDGFANQEIVRFIHQHAEQWNEHFVRLLQGHTLSDGKILMSRKLASELERARQNTLWTAGAVITGNKAVLAQMDSKTAQAIYDNEMRIQHGMDNGMSPGELRHIETQNNRAIARQNIRVGGGCSGENNGDFMDAIENNERPSFKEDDDESFTVPDYIRCIKCSAYSPKEEVVNDDNWCCPKCNYKVDICTGATLHESEPQRTAVAKRINIVAKMLNDLRQEDAHNIPLEPNHG